ncbi:hypothetical protein Pla52n_23530 [Stieleria varia]|uniref:Uncharacterized protein n=1 Tax=Stieleria varia TaxID=2528005 RepID=A0A5C6AWJ4_9BACT|nr:hypothetical protein Pla52n_23530 [Stieleria varia]
MFGPAFATTVALSFDSGFLAEFREGGEARSWWQSNFPGSTAQIRLDLAVFLSPLNASHAPRSAHLTA